MGSLPDDREFKRWSNGAHNNICAWGDGLQADPFTTLLVGIGPLQKAYLESSVQKTFSVFYGSYCVCTHPLGTVMFVLFVKEIFELLRWEYRSLI
jgi:hypothetical protein